LERTKKKLIEKMTRKFAHFVAEKQKKPQENQSQSQQSNLAVHNRVSCDGCGVSPIVGIRYKCTVCHDFDYCENCERAGNHDQSHDFTKIRQPKQYGRHFGGFFNQGGNGRFCGRRNFNQHNENNQFNLSRENPFADMFGGWNRQGQQNNSNGINQHPYAEFNNCNKQQEVKKEEVKKEEVKPVVVEVKIEESKKEQPVEVKKEEKKYEIVSEDIKVNDSKKIDQDNEDASFMFFAQDIKDNYQLRHPVKEIFNKLKECNGDVEKTLQKLL
jgi:hypothetical protein